MRGKGLPWPPRRGETRVLNTATSPGRKDVKDTNELENHTKKEQLRTR
jgi:hypothetical protein